MKVNVAFPAGGGQKLINLENDQAVRPFFDKRIGNEVPLDSLGEEWKGYYGKITGGCDKEGFPMKQGVLTAQRVRLLLDGRTGCYKPLRDGERKRKSVRGCIVDQHLSVLNLIIIKKGEKEIPGLTDKTIPRRLGPKRATKIRKLFNLDKKDDVRKYVIRRPIAAKTRLDGKALKARSKAPKIQRLITPITLQRRRHRISLKKRRAAKQKEDKAEYLKLLAERTREAREKKLERKRSRSSRLSASRTSESGAEKASTSKPAEGAPKAKIPKTAPAPAVVKEVEKKKAPATEKKVEKKVEEKKPAAAAAAPQPKKPKPAEGAAKAPEQPKAKDAKAEKGKGK